MNILKRLVKEEDGVETIEIVLILVVLIALVIVFKTQLTALLGKIFEKINSGATSV